MAKTTAYMLIGGFILVFLIGMGVIYSTIAYVNASGNMVEVAKENRENTKMQNEISDRNAQMVEQLAHVAAALTNNKNITRQVS